MFSYDLADQVTAVQHNMSNPDTTPGRAKTSIMIPMATGLYAPTGINKQYDVNGTANNLNQYNNVTEQRLAVQSHISR